MAKSVEKIKTVSKSDLQEKLWECRELLGSREWNVRDFEYIYTMLKDIQELCPKQHASMIKENEKAAANG